MDLGKKLESALVGYLQGQTYPEYFDADQQVRPGEFDEDKTQQYIRCRTADQAAEETPKDTGNFMWDCEVETITPAFVDDEAEVSQAEKHQDIATIVEDAICVSDLETQLTAAATALGEGYELTVFAAYERTPARQQEEDVYSSGWRFRVYCCSSTIPA